MNKDSVIMLTESQLVKFCEWFNKKIGKKNKGNMKLEEIFEESMFLAEAEDEDDDEIETSDPEVEKEEKVTDEQLRIDSLKIAVKISKLMNKVTPDDLLAIATNVSAYLKDHKVGEPYEAPKDEDAPTETPEDTSDETLESEPEEFEVETPEEITTEETETTENPETGEEESEAAEEEEFIVPEEFLV